jgi:hypothetical protein
VTEPSADELVVEPSCRRTFRLDDRVRGVDDGGVALVELQQDVVVACVEGDRRLVASWSRSTAGVAPRRKMSRMASSPPAKDVNPHAPRRSAGGSGWARSRTCVITPSVPSDPTKSCARSGPAGPAALTTASAVTSIRRPSTSSTTVPQTRPAGSVQELDHGHVVRDDGPEVERRGACQLKREPGVVRLGTEVEIAAADGVAVERWHVADGFRAR